MQPLSFPGSTGFCPGSHLTIPSAFHSFLPNDSQKDSLVMKCVTAHCVECSPTNSRISSSKNPAPPYDSGRLTFNAAPSHQVAHVIIFKEKKKLYQAPSSWVACFPPCFGSIFLFLFHPLPRCLNSSLVPQRRPSIGNACAPPPHTGNR